MPSDDPAMRICDNPNCDAVIGAVTPDGYLLIGANEHHAGIKLEHAGSFRCALCGWRQEPWHRDDRREVPEFLDNWTETKRNLDVES